MPYDPRRHYRSLRAIRRYIRENPVRWERDRLNPSAVLAEKEDLE